MWTSVRGFLATAVLAATLSGCFVDRSGTRTDPAVTLSAEPSLICPGDPVTVTWDASGVHRDPAFCGTHGRAFADPITCENDGECPSAGSGSFCRDALCCSNEIVDDFGSQACPNASGCLSSFQVTIVADTLTRPLVDGADRPVIGSREVFPMEDTTFTMEYGDIAEAGTQIRRVQVVTLEPPTRRPVAFPFTCAGSPGWERVDMAAVFPSVSPRVRVISVRNTSGHAIVIGSTDPIAGPIELARGEATEALNGPPVGIWSAALDPSEPRAGIRPICRPTDISNPWPDLQVEVTLGC